jgi:hypothetical protein
MPASTSTPERPKVDAGALASGLHGDAAMALAESVVLAIDWSEEADCELNQKQKVQLVYAALLASANLEATFARTIIDDLESSGVSAWGLRHELERLLGAKGGEG